MIAYNIMVGRKERRCFRARKALMEKRTARKGTVFGKRTARKGSVVEQERQCCRARKAAETRGKGAAKGSGKRKAKACRSIGFWAIGW